jgi:hypothetical protein
MNEILIVDIDALINAYNEGLARNVSTHPTDTNVNIGLYQPLTAIESTIESSLLVSDLSFAQYSLELAQETESIIDREASTPEEAFKIKDYLYSECYTTDINGNKTENLDYLVNDKVSEFSYKEGKALYKRRYTNDFNARFGANLSKAFDEKYFGKDGKVTLELGDNKYDLNFGIEKCFDCLININLEYAIPALEFTFDFSKQLQKIKELLAQLSRDLDPTLIFKMICEVGLNFGKNLICPSQLVGIQLLLPMLFGKYSLDLAKIRFDWTVVIGALVKTIVGAITSYVENIPKMIVPFIDCAINSIRAVVRYISTLLSSAENVYNTVHGAVNQVVKSLFNAYDNVESILEDLNIIDTDLEDLEDELKDISEEMSESFKSVFEAYSKKLKYSEKMSLREKALKNFVLFLKIKYNTLNQNLNSLTFNEVKTSLVEFLTTFPKYIEVILESYSEEDFQAFKEIEKEKKKLEELSEKFSKTSDKYFKETIASQKRKDYFRLDFVADNRSLSYPDGEATLRLAEKEAYNRLLNEYKKENPTATSQQLKAKETEFKARAKVLGRKMAFKETQGIINKTKDKRDLAFGINSKNAKYNRPASEEWRWYDYVFAKYGIDIENKYKTSNYNIPGKANFAKSSSKTVKEFFDTYVIKYLLEAKDYIMKVTGNVILAYKGIEKFLGEYVETDLKILGNIQELLHIIRFFRLVYELSKNGLDNCKKVKENKEVFKAILDQNNQELTFDDSLLEKQNLDPQDYLALKTKDGRYSTIIDLNKCDEALEHLSVNENNLDSIYEGILNGLHR